MITLKSSVVLFFVLSGLLGTVVLAIPVTVALTCMFLLLKNKPAKAFKLRKCVVAHRGCGNDAPENTLVAFEKAANKGAEAVEFDLEFSSDGVPIIIHDDTLDRTTNGTGIVRDHTFSDILKLSASAKHPKRNDFDDQKIPTLEQAIKLCLDLDLTMFIDVKGSSKLAVDTLIQYYEKYPELYRKAIVCSFYPQVPYLMRRRLPDAVVGLTHRSYFLTRKVDGTERFGPFWMQLLCPILDIVLEWSVYSWLPNFLGISVFLVCIQDVNQRLVNDLRNRNVDVVVWTVNSLAEKQYIGDNLSCTYMTDTMSNLDCGKQKN